MLDVLMENTDLMDLLFSFLSTNLPPLDPCYVSYFRKVVVVLIQRKYEPLLLYMQSHPNTVDSLVHHIGLYSVMELLIMIGWDDGMGQQQHAINTNNEDGRGVIEPIEWSHTTTHSHRNEQTDRQRERERERERER